MPGVYVYAAAFNDTAHPSCAYGHLSTRVNGVELRQRNNSFVRITSTGVRYTPRPTFNNFISTQGLSRPFSRARFGYVNSQRTVKWIDLNSSSSAYPCACGKKTMPPTSSPFFGIFELLRLEVIIAYEETQLCYSGIFY